MGMSQEKEIVREEGPQVSHTTTNLQDCNMSLEPPPHPQPASPAHHFLCPELTAAHQATNTQVSVVTERERGREGEGAGSGWGRTETIKHKS